MSLMARVSPLDGLAATRGANGYTLNVFAYEAASPAVMEWEWAAVDAAGAVVERGTVDGDDSDPANVTTARGTLAALRERKKRGALGREVEADFWGAFGADERAQVEFGLLAWARPGGAPPTYYDIKTGEQVTPTKDDLKRF